MYLNLCMTIKEYGSEIVIITDGSHGARCFDGKNFYFQDIVDLPVVEKTGAGDAFAIQKIGAREGFLSKKQIINFLKKIQNRKRLYFDGLVVLLLLKKFGDKIGDTGGQAANYQH